MIMPPSRRKVFPRLAVTAIVVALIVNVVQGKKITAGLEAQWIDSMGALFRPELDEPVLVVAVTQSDFDRPDLFGGISPLDPSKLAVLVQEIARHHPRCVILDILIHPAAFESPERSLGRLTLFQTLDSLSIAGSTQWIIARSPADEPDLDLVDPAVANCWRDILASSNSPAQNLKWGVPQFILERGLVRHAHTALPGNEKEQIVPTIFGAAIREIKYAHVINIDTSGVVRGHKQSEEEWLIRYTGKFPQDADSAGPTDHFVRAGLLMGRGEAPRSRSVLEDRIVLVGGTFREGRDSHWTPLGTMPGIYVWAEAIASWLRRDELREPPGWFITVLDACIGIIAGLLLARLSHLGRLAVSLVAVLFSTVIFSYLAFGVGFLFINFVPAFLGVIIHYQFEIHLELHELRRTLSRVSNL